MCWVMRRSQYIRSTPNLVTSLFKVGPSKSISPPEAIKQISKKCQMKRKSAFFTVSNRHVSILYNASSDEVEIHVCTTRCSALTFREFQSIRLISKESYLVAFLLCCCLLILKWHKSCLLWPLLNSMLLKM